MANPPTKALPLDDPFYRPRVIAERTGRHPEAIREAIRRGEMKATKIGKRSIAVRASEVQRWLDALNGNGPALGAERDGGPAASSEG
jgi:excisionase family DNA binding protein